MLNIVVPMAGHGKRFGEAGYTLPKPLIPICGIPMIRVVIANLSPSCPHKFIFVVLRGHEEHYGLSAQLRKWSPGAEIVYVDDVTQGAACTVLLASAFIDNNEPLVIANCDQYIDANFDDFVAALDASDGLIMTMTALDQKWSYVGRDALGLVNRVVEKEVISEEATVGIYAWRRGCDFVSAANAMIDSDMRVNGEFYVAPVYNISIARGADVRCHNIGSVGAGMHGIGTPPDLIKFIASPIAKKAIRNLGGASQ